MDPDARVCGVDGMALTALPEAKAVTFGEMPSGVKIAIVQPAVRLSGVKPAAKSPAHADTMPRVAQAQAAAAPAVKGMPGVVAGRYEIEAPIGAGGMGSIFRVKHVQLGKHFALKKIHVGVSTNPRVRDSFYREARLASSLEHPNIVSIVDFGEDEAIGAFMVMELLQGESLADRLEGDRRLHLKPACEVLLQVAEALHYIHERGIVHGDVKPENILLCEVPSASDRRRWQVKLLDFGIARFETAGGRTTDSIEGTPAYLAPERIKGIAPQPSVDIYSLGIVAYQMLTGVLPFDGSVYEILRAQVEKAPVPPSQHLDEPLDERAEALVLRALAKEPADRQRDMKAFLYELRTLMDMLGFRGRRRKPARQRRETARDQRKLAARVGYLAAPIPMCALDAEGHVVTANRAFAKFLTGDSHAMVDGELLYESALGGLYPQLAADVAQVLRAGVALQRVLALWDADGQPMRLVAWLVPGMEQAGDVHLVLHGLDAPPEAVTVHAPSSETGS